MKKHVKNALAGLFLGLCLMTPVSAHGYYSYEACDGEVVWMEPMDYTYYIFDNRSYDDLANQKKVTTEDVEYLIDHYVAMYPDSALKGCAQAFIDASNKTGLDPIFFLSLCGIESAWGTNKTHVELNNPYSMGMYGDGVHKGYKVDETFYDAIIEGAYYIYEHYYKAGQTTLYSMNHVEDHSFCAGDSNWEYQIASEMEFLNSLLKKRG